jgi:hypothetical protein
MSDLFGDALARWVFQRSATLALAAAEPVGPFVLPNARFFPDRFDGSPDAIGRLFERTKQHVGLDDVDVELVLVDADAKSVTSACSSGGCSTSAKLAVLSGERVVSKPEGGYVAKLASSEAGHPVVLTSALARAVGGVFLLEADVARRFAPAERPKAADLAATMLGLGVLVANAAGVETKGCGGVKVHQTTALSLPESVLALAIAAARHPELAPERVLVKELDGPAKGMIDAAMAYAAANADTVRRIGDTPEAIERGDFVLRSDQSWIGSTILGRLFGRRRAADPVDELERELSRIARS